MAVTLWFRTTITVRVVKDHTGWLLAFMLLAMVGACQSTKVSDTAPGKRQTVQGASPTQETSPQPGGTHAYSNIGEPTPRLSPLPPDAEGVRSAIAIIHEYYAAINAGDHRAAYNLWVDGGQASGQTFDEFRGGYADTEAVEIDTSGEPGGIEGAAGSQYVAIPLLINARTKDGQRQRFWGQYVLRRSLVEGAEAHGQWRIYSGEFRAL